MSNPGALVFELPTKKPLRSVVDWFCVYDEEDSAAAWIVLLLVWCAHLPLLRKDSLRKHAC